LYIIVSTTDRSPAAHVGRAEYLSVASLPASNASLAECAVDSSTKADFKRDRRVALDDHFAKADNALHPFVMATVLDPAMKRCQLFRWSVNNRLSRDDDRLQKKRVSHP